MPGPESSRDGNYFHEENSISVNYQQLSLYLELSQKSGRFHRPACVVEVQLGFASAV